MTLALVGDLHGNTDALYRARETGHTIIQVGDVGFGFRPTGVFDEAFGEVATCIRGNHDDPAIAASRPYCRPDGSYDDALDAFFLGGAWSIDWHMRTPGVSWWPEEQVSSKDMPGIQAAYLAARPSLVVTHDAPGVATYLGLMRGGVIPGNTHYLTDTGEFLQDLFEVHQPRHWVFGHYHRSTSFTLNGTTFHCVGEQDVLLLEP